MRRLASLASLAVVVLIAFCALAADAAAPLRIGSKRFTESYILAQVLAQSAAPHLPQPPEVDPCSNVPRVERDRPRVCVARVVR